MGICAQVKTAANGHRKPILRGRHAKSAGSLMDATQQHMGERRNRRLRPVGKPGTKEIGEVGHADGIDGAMISAEVGDESEDVIVVDGQRRAATVGVESQTSSAGMKV